MRLKILALLPFLLAACDVSAIAGPVVAVVSPVPPVATVSLEQSPTPSVTFTPSSTFTLTYTPTRTATITDTPTATLTPTLTLTETPSLTPDLFPYVFPIQPAYLAGFSPGGHPYPATDIFAPLGTKYVAVTNGTVDEVSTVDLWNPITNDSATAGGLSVRFIGDDGMRYYGAHLSAIAAGIQPGVWVPAGQVLGLVGNSGNARTSNTHLHFEISIPEPPFTKIDPFPYLTAWRAGESITPVLPSP